MMNKLSKKEIEMLAEVQASFIRCLTYAAAKISKDMEKLEATGEPEYLTYSVNELANMQNNLRIDLAVSRLIHITGVREANAKRGNRNEP